MIDEQYNHYVYILRCADDSLYTGVTADLEKRVSEHNESPRGAKYTRSRRPVELVYAEQYELQGDALAREAAIKQLTRDEKLKLIS